MVDAGGLSGNAANVMFLVHAMGTAAGLPVHLSPPGMLASADPLQSPQREGGSEEEHLSQLIVNTVLSIVPADPRSLVVFPHRNRLVCVWGLPQWFCS